MEEAKNVAKAEAWPVHQLINVGRRGKGIGVRTEEYFAKRAGRGDLKQALHVLQRAGKAIHSFAVTNCQRKRTGADVRRAFTDPP